MSYITTFATLEGVIMTADRQIMKGSLPHSKPLTKTARKLFTMGDNIGIVMGQAMYTESQIPVSVFIDHFCATNTFDGPEQAAIKLLELLHRVGGNIDTYVFLAGYDKSKPDQLTPEIYHFEVNKGTLHGGSDVSFCYAGANAYFKPFSERLNADKLSLLNYSLQDALNICMLATDMSRGLEKYLDFNQEISDDVEIIAITPRGIQWVRKAELEVK